MCAAITYENFDLLIEQIQGDTYRARVVGSPVGEATVDFRLPFSEGELLSFFWLSGRVFRDLRLVPDAPEPGPVTPQEFGTRLYQEVFAGQVGTCLLRSLDAVSEGAGLRIRLRLDRNVPELADLPWEFLYAPDLGRFIVLSSQTVIARYIELPQPQRPLRVTPPLRILALVSDPSNAPTLNVAQEWERLQAALADLQARGLIVLERMKTATLAALQDRLRRDDAHILHYIGHGYFDDDANSGGLLLEDEDRQGDPVDANRLATLLHDHTSLRLVFLNACEGARGGPGDFFAGTAQRLVSQKTAAVIAMQFGVSDRAGITLAQEFYEAIADGYPVDMALAEARKAVYAGGDDLEWGTPVLYLRAPDGRIFDIEWPEEPESRGAVTHRQGSKPDTLGMGTTDVSQAAITTSRNHHHPDAAEPAGTGGISVGDIYGNGIAIGNRAQVMITQGSGSERLVRLFETIYQRIEMRSEDPNVRKETLIGIVKLIEQEVTRGQAAEPKKVESWLQALGEKAPDLAQASIDCLRQPNAGVPPRIRAAANKSGGDSGRPVLPAPD